jgi:hypothetical protein
MALIEEAMRSNDRCSRPGIDPCRIWPYGKDRKGYGRVNLPGGGLMYVTRELMKREGHDIEGLVVRHLCHNGHNGCMTMGHLATGTTQDNKNDDKEAGRTFKGEMLPNFKLKEWQIKEIRALRGTLSSTETGKNYGMSRQAINDIWKRRSWAHVD